MIVAITGIIGIGQTFMDWSINYLCGAKRYWQYDDLEDHAEWNELSDNPIAGANAHGHKKSHPGSRGAYQFKLWVDEAHKIENEYPIVFYPVISGDGKGRKDFLEQIKQGTKLLKENGCKVIFLNRVNHFPLFQERISRPTKEKMYFNIATILGEDGLSDRLIRKRLSVLIFPRQKTLLEKYQEIVEDCKDDIDLAVTDREWHHQTQDTMKRIFEVLGLEIVPERWDLWVPISQQWATNQMKLYDFHEKLLPNIAKAIVENKDIDWPDWEMDIVQESVIMAWIMRNHKKKLELPDDHFPHDPKYLHKFIK